MAWVEMGWHEFPEGFEDVREKSGARSMQFRGLRNSGAPEEGNHAPVDVLVLATTFYPKVNGTTTAVADLATGLARRGHKVHLITRRFPRTNKLEEYNGVEVERVGLTSGPSSLARLMLVLGILVATMSYVRTHRTAVIHTNGFVSLWVAIIARSIFSTPVIATSHGLHRLWLQDAQWRSGSELALSYPLERIALARADIVIVQSAMLGGIVSSLYGVSREKIRVVAHSADPDFFKPPGGARSNTVLFVGTLGRVYAADILLRSIPHVLSEARDARFVIVGTGPLKESLQELAGQLGVQASVDFVGRIRDRRRLAAMYTDAALVAVPLRYPGYILSKVAVEAMASGKPVITTMKLDEDLKQASVFTTGSSPQELAVGILSVLKADDESYQRMSEAAYEYAQIHCSGDAVMSEIERVYSDAKTRRAQD